MLIANHNDVHNIFGTVEPPDALRPFIGGDQTGAAGISLFFNNLIVLIYIIAAVAFVFMLLWGALQWILSGGNKEALDGARRRLTHAIIGIILLAITFALLRVIGTFTGFTFFT